MRGFCWVFIAAFIGDELVIVALEFVIAVGCKEYGCESGEDDEESSRDEDDTKVDGIDDGPLLDEGERG